MKEFLSSCPVHARRHGREFENSGTSPSSAERRVDGGKGTKHVMAVKIGA